MAAAANSVAPSRRPSSDDQVENTEVSVEKTAGTAANTRLDTASTAKAMHSRRSSRAPRRRSRPNSR
jgi:hypothetical protein